MSFFVILGGSLTLQELQGPVLDHQNNVNFWVSPKIVEVKMSTPNNPQSPENYCKNGPIDKPTFSQINGILHNVNCRDVSIGGAPGDLFMASGNHPEIAWHEFHHAAYGLADEYYRVDLVQMVSELFGKEDTMMLIQTLIFMDLAQGVEQIRCRKETVEHCDRPIQ